MKIIIIGGGISGIFAAIESKRLGHEVLVLEKKDRILKKMLTTGNGRCNLTNVNVTPEHYNSKFVSKALSSFTNRDFIDYLKTIAVFTTCEGNKVYPQTLKAQTVVTQLLEEVKELGIEVITSSPVLKVEKKNNFTVYTNEHKYVADRVVFATGGCSSPNLGSDGKSFEVLKSLGHKITDLYPALTQLTSNSRDLKSISGVKVYSKPKLYVDGNFVQEEEGEVLFTEYGLSGPPILNLSKKVNMERGDKYMQFSLINYSNEDTKDELYNMYYMFSHYPLKRWLMGIVDKKLVAYICKKLDLNQDVPVGNIDENKFKVLVQELLEHRVDISGTKGFETSQVTLGGVELSQVDEITFESKVVKGLYIIGEALNIDGVCGGYNIQWAVSSAIMMSRNL